MYPNHCLCKVHRSLKNNSIKQKNRKRSDIVLELQQVLQRRRLQLEVCNSSHTKVLDVLQCSLGKFDHILLQHVFNSMER